RDDLGVPHTLADLGIKNANVATLARSAVDDPTAATNPRKLDEAAAARIFDAAMTGDFSKLGN
ncbi:hypothetical protein MNBD_ALPHA09-672, partial [hydrothermal vent metagenome]